MTRAGLAALAAITASVAGLFLSWSMVAQRPAAGAAQVDDLSLSVASVAWGGEDLHQEMARSNFPMPPSMMPGAPTDGFQRLHVEVLLANSGGAARSVGPQEFRLRSADGRTWSLKEDSFRGSVLRPGQLVDLDLYFDVDQQASDLSLVWMRGGREARIRVAGASPSHDHAD